jgi:hypothetical protein
MSRNVIDLTKWFTIRGTPASQQTDRDFARKIQALSAQRAAPGGRSTRKRSIADPGREAELLEDLRSLTAEKRQMVLTMIRGLVGGPAKTPALVGTDVELAWQCQQVVATEAAVKVTYAAITENPVLRDKVIEALQARWAKLSHRIIELDLPGTPHGARAAADALLCDPPRNLEEARQNADLRAWLAIACATYIARTTTAPAPEAST